MTEKAAVKFQLDSSLENWTKFTSPEVVAAGFKWFVSGEHIGCGCAAEDIKYCDGNINSYKFEFAIRNTVIHCSPVSGKKTSIWACDAILDIDFAFASGVQEPEMMTAMTHAKHWSHVFTFHNPESVAVEIDFHKEFSAFPIYYIVFKRKRVFSELEFRVTVISRKMFDLCDPQNKMIKTPEDAAKVIVEGTTLWLSKEVLGGACPFFHAYFNNDFKEKRDGVFPLPDVKLDEVWRFVAIIYGVHIDIDKTSLQYLLLLEDKYQCEAVRTKCHAYLVATDKLTHQEKLRIGDRFRFEDVIDAAIEKMNIQELTEVGQQMELETHSHKTTLRMFKAVLERR